MSEKLYLVDPVTKALRVVDAVALADIGIKERQDLEQWVVNNPEVLGEELLIVTSEFDRFDKSSKRLDALALDKEGKLVVIELKLDLSGTFADQQAIRYAAFCSTMTFDDIADAYAKFHATTAAAARQAIYDFLGTDEPTDPDSRTRIILAAGSLDDQELTSTVLWLRSFGLDITCLEMAPYRLPDYGQLILVPRTIIPLPEARDFIVKVQRKEQVIANRAAGQYRELWDAVAAEFAQLNTRFPVSTSRGAWFLQVPIGHNRVHYEWLIQKTKRSMHVAVHWELHDREANFAMLEPIQARAAEIGRGVEYEFIAGPWGKHHARAAFVVPCEDFGSVGDIAPEAARVMDILIDRTWPILEPLLTKGTGNA